MSPSFPRKASQQRKTAWEKLTRRSYLERLHPSSTFQAAAWVKLKMVTAAKIS